MTKTNKQIIIVTLGLFLVLSLMSFAMAETYCIQKLRNGQSVLCVSGYVAKTEHLDCRNGKCTAYGYYDPAGYREVCLDSTGYYAFNRCNGVTGIEACSGSGSGSEPNLTLAASFPFADGGVFTKQSFFMDISTSKIANIDLIDNIKGTEVNLCPNCMVYKKSMTFRQGENDITIRAVKGIEVKEQRIKFYIDNKAPRILSTVPAAKKFANGEFSVYYDEDNVKKITLYYGTSSPLNKLLTGCLNGTKQSCSANVDLNSFDGKTINYWFEIEDIAGNKVVSKPAEVYVDTSGPLIEDINYSIDRGNINLNIKVKEAYLKTVGYIDNSDPRLSEKVLCPTLKNNICEKKLSFRDGEHNITIFVIDQVGNRVERQIKFITDAIAPRITLTSPKSGYADGLFKIEFIEGNPRLLELKYGNILTGMRTRTVNLATECSEDKGKTACSVNVPLTDYNNQDITYLFSLTDVVNSKAEIRPIKLKVDSTAPKITNFAYSGPVKGYVTFNVTVDEKNPDKIVYYDNGGKAMTLCSGTLKNNFCSKKVSFRPGSHDVKIEAIDKAGNVDSKIVPTFTV